MALVHDSTLRTNSKYFERPKFIFDKLQAFLRMIKNQQTKDFFKLYYFKSELSRKVISAEEERQKTQEFLEYWSHLQNKKTVTFTEPFNAQKMKILDYIQLNSATLERNSKRIIQRESLYYY